MRCRVPLLVLSLALAACDGRPAAPTWRDRAVAYERGHGHPRDYRQAAAIYAEACADGDGAITACRYLGLARLGGRGVELDRRAGFELLHRACARGDDVACAWVAGGDPDAHDRERLFARGEAACDAGELEACALLFTFASFAPCDDAACVARGHAKAEALCARGALEVCRGILDAHRPAAATAAAQLQLSAGCDDGDADACAALPDRALPADELCRAGDARACRDATDPGDQGQR